MSGASWIDMKDPMEFFMGRGILIMGLLAVLSFPAKAAESVAGPAFFEALYDVPVMPGLEEIPDQAMLFDKPGGRIASVVAGSKTVDAAQVSRFYAESLPQLGWKKTAENQYVRGDDKLVVDITKRPPLTVVHFTLSPGKP